MNNQLKQRKERLQRLLDLFEGKKKVLIMLHNYPDPDSIASGCALKYLLHSLLGLKPDLTFGGVVGRAENKAVLKYLKVRPLKASRCHFEDYEVIALVDTQPSAGNNSLPPSIQAHVAIDHHPIRPLTRKVRFHDIESSYGATSTIMTEYLQAAELEIETKLATSLLYGIKTDTLDLGFSASKADIEAVLALYPLANLRILSKIEYAKVSPLYFRSLCKGIEKARWYDKGILIADLGQVEHPDLLAEMANLFLRIEKVRWILCMGRYEKHLYISVRSHWTLKNADKVIRKAIGKRGTAGGHETAAGAQIPLNGVEDPDALAQEIINSFLRTVKAKGETSTRLMDKG